MLILTRKLGESMIVGDNITIKITEINGSNVRIGIDAPDEVKIIREELLTGKKAPIREVAFGNEDMSFNNFVPTPSKSPVIKVKRKKLAAVA